MSGETTEVPTQVDEETVVTEVTTTQASNDDVKAELATMKAQIEKQSQLIDKLRDHEQSSLKREQDAIAARSGVEGELDALEQKFNKQLEGVLIDSALEKELTLAGARNVEVTKKLLDKQDIKVVNGKADVSAIQSSIESLKESEGYMFKGDSENENPLVVKPTATPVARAGESENENIVHKELRAATSIEDLKKIIDKHNVT